jgi:hypothetical protein
MTEMPNRPIEMGVATSDGTFYYVTVNVPADTPVDKLFEVCQAEALKLHQEREDDREVRGTWLHDTQDDECPDFPRRLEVTCILSFDADETTVGTDIEQGEAAVDQINLVLQREPHGLGARLEKF